MFMERRPQLIPTQPGVLSALEQVDSLNELAWELRRQDSSRALNLAGEAHTLALSLDYNKGVAYSLLAKSFALFRLARLPEARGCGEEAKGYFGTLEDKQGLLKVWNTLGIVYAESGDLLAALRAFLQVGELCKEISDYKGEADALNNIANVHSYLGDYVSALDYHFQSLAVCQAHAYPEAQTDAFLNLGVAYHELGQYTEALEYFLKGLEGAKSEPFLHALALRNIGRSHQKLAQNDLARSYFLQSLQLSEESFDPIGISNVLDNLAVLAMSQKQAAEAEGHLQESWRLKREAGDTRGQSETLVLLGQLAVQEGNLEEAKTYLRNALVISEQIGNTIEKYQAHQHLSNVYKAQGSYKEALESFQAYSELREAMLNENSSQHLKSLRVQFEVSQAAREKEIFRLKNVELAEKNEKLNKLNDALQRANAEKSRLLAELERQAKEDALTGLYNRRYFDDVFARSFAQSQRLTTPLSIAISDIDNFKQVNDRFSHQMGDLVLRTVAKIMKESVRDIDTVARYGGEEFLVLLPAADAQSAKVVCERIRTAVENYPWHTLNPDLKITLSMGVSDDIAVANCDRMMALADDNLYKAKRSGKNQVHF
jgi:diguanylate cyclase (GGDEF)-like protein